MAITNDEFTPEELDAVLTKKPELLQTLTGTLSKREYTVFDKTQKQSFETNLETNIKSNLTLQHATDIEKDVFETTGVKKKDNEKYFDYLKRVLGEKVANEKLLQTENQQYKSSSDISAAERKQLEDQKILIDSKNGEIDTLKNSHQSEVTKLKAENKIYGDISKVDAKLKKDIDTDLLNLKRDQVVSEMINSAKFNEQGKIVFFGADGMALANADASFKTAEQVYSEKMDKYIEKGKTQTGAGGSGEGNPEVVASGMLKTKQDVDIYLSKQGFIAGTQEYKAQKEKFGYSKLPLQ